MVSTEYLGWRARSPWDGEHGVYDGERGVPVMVGTEFP